MWNIQISGLYNGEGFLAFEKKNLNHYVEY